ncbi:unnamed protein product [Rotaria sordida]|uniref:N-acetyltransferase domain-containing protein n=1 Tax=Rotaria sordida TaxID=392033 RepID=A0A815A4N7_9BILA|nr:unnamed protein product [Rotaria sordida]CAF3815321.1 unnamed protein product [Rotaria sordida]
MASNDEYEIALIDNEIDARLCAKLIAEEFALHNPLMTCNRVTGEQLFEQRHWPLMINVLDEKLSFLIRHRPTNEIIAAVIANDLFLYCKKYPYDESSPASLYPTRDILSEMVDQFVHHDFNQELKPNMVLFIIAGATRPKHTGKNLAAQLRTHICNYARDIKGFQYAFIQTCNPATHHIYIKKMNGKETRIVDPATWVWKKKNNGLFCPLKDYNDEPVVNILVDLIEKK